VWFWQVTYDGNVYTWGIGDDGRLGHGDEEEEYTPRMVEKAQGRGAICVVCGDEHTMVLTKVLVTDLDDMEGVEFVGQ
jgi:alpha-tubulin suppressor-like RCC1 family protein